MHLSYDSPVNLYKMEVSGGEMVDSSPYSLGCECAGCPLPMKWSYLPFPSDLENIKNSAGK